MFQVYPCCLSLLSWILAVLYKTARIQDNKDKHGTWSKLWILDHIIMRLKTPSETHVSGWSPWMLSSSSFQPDWKASHAPLSNQWETKVAAGIQNNHGQKYNKNTTHWSIDSEHNRNGDMKYVQLTHWCLVLPYQGLDLRLPMLTDWQGDLQSHEWMKFQWICSGFK